MSGVSGPLEHAFRAEEAAHWRSQADEYDRRCDAVLSGLHSDGTAPPEEVDTMTWFGRIKQVVDLIVEAVETSVQ